QPRQWLGAAGCVPHGKDRRLTVLCLDAAGTSRLGHYPNERTAGELLSLGELSWSARKASQVRWPTARAGARVAPARDARAAPPRVPTRRIRPCRGRGPRE